MAVALVDVVDSFLNVVAAGAAMIDDVVEAAVDALDSVAAVFAFSATAVFAFLLLAPVLASAFLFAVLGGMFSELV